MGRVCAFAIGLLAASLALAPCAPAIRPAPMPRGWKPDPVEMWLYAGGIPWLC